jgi:hypothetical protein
MHPTHTKSNGNIPSNGRKQQTLTLIKLLIPPLNPSTTHHILKKGGTRKKHSHLKSIKNSIYK